MGRKRKVDCLKNGDIKLDPDCFDDGEPSGKGARIADEAARTSANERERDRMRVLSKAFTKLKTSLPWVPPDTKLSKLDTLKLASCYIAHLRQILSDDDSENSPVMAGIATRNMKSGNNNVHPMALTWPFSFNGRSPCPGENMYGGNKPLSNNKYS